MAAKARASKKPTRSGTQASRQAKTAGPGARPGGQLAWGITGLAMGLLVALIVHLEHTRPQSPADPDHAAGAATDAAAGAVDDEQPRFEFYRLLSEQEVEVASREAQTLDNDGALPEADAADAEPASAAPTAADAGAARQPGAARYLLQAGSFRSQADADSLKASLALLGIEARIQVVELPGGETWHRVRIGPFADLQRVNAVRERMAGEQIDAILLRAGG